MSQTPQSFDPKRVILSRTDEAFPSLHNLLITSKRFSSQTKAQLKDLDMAKLFLALCINAEAYQRVKIGEKNNILLSNES